jgi:RND family efflux transporter MFP subunit
MTIQARPAPPALSTGICRATTYVSLSFAVLLAPACSKSSSAEANSHPRPTASSAASAVSRPDAGGKEDTPRPFEVSGVAAAARTATLASKGQGVLRSIKVREGDRVKAGQVLAVLDATDMSIRAQSAQVAHQQALAALANARDDMDRASQLYDAGAMPDQAMEKIKLGLKMAELQVQAAQVGIRMAQQALSDATIRAPFSGVISKVLAEEGNYITVMPPSPIFVLSDTDHLEVRASVPERKLSILRKDMPVVVTLPSVHVTRDAKIDRLSDVIDPMSRSLDIVISIDNTDHALPAGLFARVSFPSVPFDDGDPGLVDPPPAPSAAASGESGGR